MIQMITNGTIDNRNKWLLFALSAVIRPIHPVRNDAPPLSPVHHAVQGSAGGLDFRIIPVGFDDPLEFLTGFTPGFFQFFQGYFVYRRT
jgi:hypothetical protein